MGTEKKPEKTCRSCGAKVHGDYAFCPHCGSKHLVSEKKHPTTATEKDSVTYAAQTKGPNLMVVAGIVAIVIVGITLVIAAAFDWAPEKKHPVDQGVTGENPSVGDEEELSLVNGDASLLFEGLGSDYLGEGGALGPDPKGEMNWAYDLGDTVAGAPAYGGGLVYAAATGLAGGGDYARGTVIPDYVNTIFALDSMTGELKWKYSLLVQGKMDSAELFAEGSSVYAVVKMRDMGVSITKLDSSQGGAPLWGEPVSLTNTMITGAVLHGGLLVASSVSATDGVNRVRAYDTDSGELKWGLATAGEPGPPVALDSGFALMETVKGEGVYIVFIDMEGRQVSRTQTSLASLVGKPVATEDNLIVSGLWSFGRFKVECYDAGNLAGDPVWQWDARVPGDEPPLAGFVVLAGKCYFISPTGGLVTIDMETGKEILPAGEFEYNLVMPPVSSGGIVSTITDDSLVIGISSSEPPELKWSTSLPGGMKPEVGEGLAYGNGRLFIPCENGILVAVE